MQTRTVGITMLTAVVLATAVGALLYPLIPDQIASHWNLAGEVDDYMPKFFGIFLLPLFMLAVVGIWAAIPHVDPLQKNIEKFRSAYDAFFLALFLLFLYIFALILLWNVGVRFNFTRLVVPGLAFLFAAIGVMLKHTKRNWFVGIRTPWTLSSDKVWEKTHHLGSILFKISAAVILLGILLPNYLVWLVFVPVAVSAAATVIYSYIEFKHEVR